MHGPPKLVRETPILGSQDSDAIIMEHTTVSDPNYKSFRDLGSYSHAAISDLIDGKVLIRLDEFKPARSVFAKFPWIRQVRSCSLGMVSKKRDIAYGIKIGLDISQEGGSRDFDAHLARSGASLQVFWIFSFHLGRGFCNGATQNFEASTEMLVEHHIKHTN
jgi:hypothetical protein